MASKGWNTTDEDEINIRKKRAEKEYFEIINLKKRSRVFSSYEVKSKNSTYLVEIRSLVEDINSCSCPDISTNRLGTCKHIEAVKLLHKDKKSKNQKIEIFLDTRVDKIKILFPHKKEDYLKSKLGEYFSENGELLHEPTIAFKSLMRFISSLDDKYKKDIRVSSLIEPWIRLEEFKIEKERNKKSFLIDYKNGKRSFEFLKYPLFDYQKEGVLHLAFNERALLADDMGLGKTIQAIGASVLLQRMGKIKKVLVISPASLKAEWEEQIAKFTDLDSKIIEGNRIKREKIYKLNSFFYIANYEQILYDLENINNILKPDVVILDEAQRIKNWQTKTANKIKKLKSRYAFVLTGTPIENRIDEVYSIVQFLDPKIFGSLFRFNRDFYKLDSNGMAIGYKNMNLLHKRLQPVMLRRKKSDIEGELPSRVDKTYLVNMDKSAQDMYDEYESMVSRLAQKAKRYPLSAEEMKKLQLGLSCMRILCDSVYILDQRVEKSPKIDEALPLIEELLEDKERKIIIFSEWEKMLQLLNKALSQKDIKVAWHTGALNQKQRRDEINRFKEDSDCNILLSTDSGSVGLNLQVANVVINLDMPWNPAKLEQRIARAWRKHQKRVVQVINFVTQDRIEHRIVEIVKQKQFLSDNVLDGLGENELKLPSSRKEFLKDLDNILNDMPVGKDKDETLQQSNFKDDILSVLSDRVEMVAKSKKSGSFFVVIDKKDETGITKIEEIKRRNIEDKDVTILDLKEFNLLKSLAERGLIELKDDLEILCSNQAKSKTLDFEVVIKIEDAFSKIKRKHDMVKLLVGGGFEKESIPASLEIFQESLKIEDYFKENGINGKSFDCEIFQSFKNKNLKDETILLNIDTFFDKLKSDIKSLKV